MKYLNTLRAYNLIAAIFSAVMTIWCVTNRDYGWAITMLLCTAVNHMYYNHYTKLIKSKQNEKDNSSNPS